MKRYILFIWGGVEADTLGPFDTETARDVGALEAFASHGPECEYFRLDIQHNVPALRAFTSEELEGGSVE